MLPYLHTNYEQEPRTNQLPCIYLRPITSRNVSEELLVVPVPLDAVQGVAHHLVVTEEREVLTHLGQQRAAVRVAENHDTPLH